jgi:hypothetical protein
VKKERTGVPVAGAVDDGTQPSLLGLSPMEHFATVLPPARVQGGPFRSLTAAPPMWSPCGRRWVVDVHHRVPRLGQDFGIPAV